MEIGVVIGTRPEAIKMIPIIIALRKKNIFVKVINTGQHKEMIDVIFMDFGIVYDYNLKVMLPDQSLSDLASILCTKLDQFFKIHNFDFILVHGDTLTCFVASITAFWNKIKVAHIEAGLRTYNLNSPFPEEMNRQLTSRIASIHFAPTQTAVNNLIKEGIDENKIILCGNSVIDALLIIRQRIQTISSLLKKIELSLDPKIINWPNKIILITAHRRENFGDNLIDFASAINELSKKYPDILFVYPVHLNPNVKNVIFNNVNSNGNISLISPVDYKTFVYLMEKSHIIITDSGGIQEEAPSLGKPVLVLRDTTERQEALDKGCAKLIGMNKLSIIFEVSLLIDSDKEYNKMSNVSNPFGSGNTADIISDYFLNLA